MKEFEDSTYIYQNELDKASFKHDKLKYFIKIHSRKASNKSLVNAAFNIAKNRDYDGHKRVPASMVYSFFGKKSGKGQELILKTKN